MNFFAAQDRAKKKTKYLVLIYLLVLLVLTVLSSLVLMLFVPIALGQPLPSPFWQSIFSQEQLPLFAGVGAFVIGGALISSYIKSRHLSKGGGVIAASLGGVKISPNTSDLNERKALNVVEEMAIASGMPMLEVYLLKNESGINAFAAGQTPMDAVIGVTQGCVDKLTRAQLQGVIGHEFSHILNGDMRLNLRIIMLLHGIEFIGLLGRILTSSQRHRRHSSSRSRSKGNGVVVLAGIALRLIGWFGILFGNLIQAAVSRQREFLADASSVQFTRDPTTIADALKVIGGSANSSRLSNTDVNEVAHMFFGQSFVTRFSMLFATHPPIEMRIRTLEPGWDGAFLKPLTPPVREDEAESLQQFELPEPLAILMAAGVVLDQLNSEQQKQLSNLTEQVNDPLEAMALIIAILLEASDDLSDTAAFSAMFDAIEIKGLQNLVVSHWDELRQLGKVNTLPLVELSMPALKQMSEQQYADYKTLLAAVMMLDGKQTVFEQSIHQLVTRYLDVHFGLEKVAKVRYRKARQVAMELQQVFSVLVHYGHKTDGSSTFTIESAFKKAMMHVELVGIQQVEVDESNLELFHRATEKLLYCSLPLKHKIVEAMTLCIEHDGHVNETEKELVLAIAATMDAPLPRLTSVFEME